MSQRTTSLHSPALATSRLPEWEMGVRLTQVVLNYIPTSPLSEHFCQMCIDKFDADENKYKGLIGSGVYEPEFKDSTDLHISSLSDWKYEDGIFFKSLNEHLEKHMFSGLVKQFTGADHVDILMNGLDDTGYQIQRTEPGGGYTWHTDFNIIKPHIDNCGVRMLLYMVS